MDKQRIGPGDAVMTPRGLAKVLFIETTGTETCVWWVEGSEDGVSWQSWFEGEYLTLLKPVDDLTARLERFRLDVKRAREFAGDNLPASSGLQIVSLLDEALRKVRRTP